MRVLEGMQGKQVAEQMGISEPTVSRHLQKVRTLLRDRLAEIVGTYSFTSDELAEAETAGLGRDDVLFDEALSELYRRHVELLEIDDSRQPTL
jgi:predicted transcriptional regulator